MIRGAQALQRGTRDLNEFGQPVDVVEKLVLQVTWGDSKLFDAGGGQLLGRDHIFVSIGQCFYYDVGQWFRPPFNSL